MDAPHWLRLTLVAIAVSMTASLPGISPAETQNEFEKSKLRLSKLAECAAELSLLKEARDLGLKLIEDNRGGLHLKEFGQTARPSREIESTKEPLQIEAIKQPITKD
jgi:hypothetical protein